jgi:hypothetical protein
MWLESLHTVVSRFTGFNDVGGISGFLGCHRRSSSCISFDPAQPSNSAKGNPREPKLSAKAVFLLSSNLIGYFCVISVS